MFQSARLKLTAWYLLIIMFISIFFSFIIYRFLTNELQRFALTQRYRIERRLNETTPELRFRIPMPPDPQLIEEVENRIIIILVMINGVILIASGGIGYFLAGRTLKPIKDMMEEQNRFTADASHEFRTPLTALKTNIEVTLADKNLSITEAKKVLHESLADVNDLQTLSDALLQLAHYQTVNGNLYEAISIKNIIENSLKKVQLQAKQKKIVLNNTVEDKTFEGDFQRISELMVILLDNAIKYSPEKSTVTILSKHTDSHIHISVTDQGVGIAEKDIPHIFDRFYRADKSRSKNRVSGYGLGLSIAKKIINEHRGSLSVKSKVNSGTTFGISLPVKQKK